MNTETENFIIESDKKINYFDEIVENVKEFEKKLLGYFELKKLERKYTISIVKYDTFKDLIISKYGKIQNYQRGNTDYKSRKITILDFDDQIKYTNHKDSNVADCIKMIKHEMVHAFNSEFNHDYRQTIWFREGLAINLAKQNYEIEDLSSCDFEKLKNDWYNYGKTNYRCAYIIVRYMLETFAKDEVLEYVADSNFLRANADKIFEEAKEYFKEMYRMENPKYLKVVRGTDSSNGIFEYKIDKINVANNWNPNGKT